MKLGHKHSQDIFIDMGRKLNYLTKKSFSRVIPTDGVWFVKHPMNLGESLPISAIEVIVSESSKTILGSISTLEKVSPLIAIILVHESEITRRIVLQGGDEEKAIEKINNLYKMIASEISSSHQRFELWNEHSLTYWYKNIKGRKIIKE